MARGDVCRVDGCKTAWRPDRRFSHGLCSKHYERFRVHGDPGTVLPPVGRKPVGPRKCERCKRVRRLRARGMCPSCYNTVQRQTGTAWRQDAYEDVVVVGLDVEKVAETYNKSVSAVRRAVSEMEASR